MKLLCCADLHLHEWPALAPVDRLADQRNILEQIATLAFDRDVDAVLIAGDVFHRPQPTPAVLEVFRRFATAVNTLEIPVVAIVGNASHDLVNGEEYAALELFDDLVHVRRHPDVVEVAGIAVACLPSVPVAGLSARVNGADRDEVNQEAALLLIETARELRAQIPDGTPAVLLAHWSVSGAAFPNGLPVDAAREPVLPMSELEQLGFDRVVAGHIHRRQPLSDIGFYCGSPLPLDFGESGFDHGVVIVDLDGGCVVDEFVPLESRAFVTIDVDADALVDPDAAWCDADFVANAIVRLRYTATDEQARRLNTGGMRDQLLATGAARVVVQPTIVREDRARVEGLDEELNELDAVGLWVDAQGLDDTQAQSLRTLTASYLETVAA